MMNALKVVAAIGVLFAAAIPGHGEDRLAEAVDRLRGADCVAIEFLSITRSDFFDYVDTTDGEVYLAADSRYRVRLGPDTYLHTGDTLYSYSAKHNQVTVEGGMSYLGEAEQVSWLRRLDHWYDWQAEGPWLYSLDLKESEPAGDLPGQMTVRVDSLDRVIEWLEYEDINGDLNRLLIRSQRLDSPCRDTLFDPRFPDSVEVITLP